MPPVQQNHLPTETREAPVSTSGFRFSIQPLWELVARAGRPLLTPLGSAIRLGRAGTMTKPGNVGAPTPINTLSNNTSTSSRTPFGISSASRSIPSTPPAAKRRKVDEIGTNSSHSNAFFAVADTPSPRRLSIGSISVTDSQRSVGSNKSPSQSALGQYRGVDRWTKKHQRSRSFKKDPTFSGQEDDLTDDEVDLISPQKAPADLHKGKRKREEGLPISELSNRFKEIVVPAQSTPLPSQIFSRTIDKAEKRMRHQEADLSPDELALSSEEIAAGRPTKRPRNFSPSLSKRGSILPTNFGGVLATRASAAMTIENALERKKDAKSIIEPGLRILRGASGQCYYKADYEEDPDHCYLSIREIGHTLSPVDQENNLLKSYVYLTLDLKNVKTILRPDDAEKCRIITVNFISMNLAHSAGPKLMVEFASTQEFIKLFEWVNLYIDLSRSVSIKLCDTAKLEEDFDEMIQRAKYHKPITDSEVRPSVADDIKVIQHNQNRRAPIESSARPKLRDAMKPSTSKSNAVASSRPCNPHPTSVQRQLRTTYSMFTCLDSPEPELEPEPEGWTSLNAGWEKHWRNSLVYPNTGKNRATIDKDDIQRLDEGQFLNDNIIIFYLRYLQKSLEDNNGDLAKRIYFQNTFFYDKLKPTKTGQGINYDSVKTWTSKVDIFSKDYIIVPINEYTHWYVAIICNAPKLIPSSINQNQGQVDGTLTSIAAVPNDTLILEISETSSQNEKLDSDPNGEHVDPIREDVVETLRRMSIDSFDRPNETKQKADKNIGEATDSTPTNNGPEVYVIKDSDRPEVEVEHIATTANLQTRKKTGKRQSVGPRKYDPNQPRIITLDSLGASHSPTCSYLKQYLVAELRDKKGIEIPPPGAMGATAKDVPEQTNHCDCGLFLLGYIQEFLLNPDRFVRSLLQRDGDISWHLDPSELRTNIRDLIFDLQKKQQKNEDLVQEKKRRAKISTPQPKLAKTSNHTTSPAMNPLHTTSKLEQTNQNCRGDKVRGSKSPPAPKYHQLPSTNSHNTIPGEAMSPDNFQYHKTNVEPAIMNVQPQPSAQTIQSNSSNATQQSEIDNPSNVQEVEARPSDPHIVASLRKFEPVLDHGTHHQAPSMMPISPVRGQAVEYHLPSSETEASKRFQRDFVPPIVSETPSSKSSRGVTPNDPVVVDDSDNNERNGPWKSSQRHRGGQTGHQLVVEIPSTSIHNRSPGKDGKTDDSKQTGEKSSYFANRRNGEKVTAAKLRDNDVIDLSDD
ncbi:hypothetical protein GGS24DRAFT_177534 [Hypoxylon argillaceum]|nr:hypothetical protein GGS24DRAFT_177534 [Hypoxylon argillaceum]